ncbi:glycosyltransferase, partial [bacterium]|nr:glycosyltransferase [bacterium]
LEAMASGLPTIGTLVGGIPDFLEDGKTGIVCQPGDIDSIVKAITRASKLSDDEKKELHSNSMKLVNETFNWDSVANRMEHLFKIL